MNLDRVSSGHALPNDINVIIGIPMNADSVKYEVDKESSAFRTSRLQPTIQRKLARAGFFPYAINCKPIFRLYLKLTPQV